MKKVLVIASMLALFASATYSQIKTLSGESNTYGTITREYTSETNYQSLKYTTYRGGSIIVNGDIYNTYTDYTWSGDTVGGLVKESGAKLKDGDTTDYSTAPHTTIVTGTVHSIITGNSQITGYGFYGGNGGNYKESTSYVGAVEVKMLSGYVNSMGLAGGANNNVLGNVTLNVSGGKVDEIIGANGGSSVGGSISIRVSGGIVDTIYAGGQGAKSVIGNGTSVVISGDAQVNNIYGGSWLPAKYDSSYSTGTIKNGTSITLKDSVNVSGVINGGCIGYKTQIENIEGDKVLNFQSYNGTLDATIENMEIVNISADSKVEFANAFDVETLVVEAPTITLFSTDAQVTLAEGTTFDTLTLVGDFEQNQINLNTVFGDSAGVVLSALEDKNTALTVIDSNGQEWATENLSSENGILSFEKGAAIPEASTYAMIFGAIALGFVAYRRRK